MPATPQGLPQRPGEVGAKCGTCRQAGGRARTVQQEHGTHQIKIAANITRSGSDKERGVNPNLPLHYRMPHHHAGTQRISVTSKLVRPLRTRQQLPDSPLAAIHQLTAHKNNTQQWCRPVMIRFRGQIRGPQLRNTIKARRLKSTTQLLRQFAFHVCTNVPSDWEPLIRLDLQCWHHWVLFMQEEEQRVAM